MKRLNLILLPFLVFPAVILAHGTGEDKAPHPTMKMEKLEEADDGHGALLGKPGDPRRATRTIALEARDDMSYKPSTIHVKPGETVRIRVRNVGKVTHEAVLGSKKELEAHAAMMRKFPHMEHDDPNQVVVPPGETRDLVWRFTREPGSYDFACLVPGHYEAGMVGKIVVK